MRTRQNFVDQALQGCGSCLRFCAGRGRWVGYGLLTSVVAVSALAGGSFAESDLVRMLDGMPSGEWRSVLSGFQALPGGPFVGGGAYPRQKGREMVSVGDCGH